MSDKLPVISRREAVRALTKAGFEVVPNRGKGSHIVMSRPGWRALLTIPDHSTLRRGTLRALIRDAGLTVDEFRDLL